MDDLTDSNWMLNQDLLPDDTIPQNAQANADFNNSLTPCNVTVDLPSIFPLPQPSAAGLSGNDKSETELRGEDDESLQDEVELLDLHIEDLDLQIRQLQVQRSLTSEQLLNDQDILSLKRQKNELQQRRMTLRRQRRKLLRATEVTDGRPGVSCPLPVRSRQGMIIIGVSASSCSLVCGR